MKKYSSRLAKLQKNLSRKQKGSNNRKKAKVKVAKLHEKIADASWSEFRRMLEYKAKWSGRKIIIAPSNYASSQLCSNYNNKSSQTKDLSCRTYICPVCGMIMDRDVNTSKNLLKLAI